MHWSQYVNALIIKGMHKLTGFKRQNRSVGYLISPNTTAEKLTDRRMGGEILTPSAIRAETTKAAFSEENSLLIWLTKFSRLEHSSLKLAIVRLASDHTGLKP